MNEGKSILLHDDREEVIKKEICDLFGVASIHLDKGFIYLGFKLKPNGYCNRD